jgi:hypothetical protein
MAPARPCGPSTALRAQHGPPMDHAWSSSTSASSAPARSSSPSTVLQTSNGPSTAPRAQHGPPTDPSTPPPTPAAQRGTASLRGGLAWCETGSRSPRSGLGGVCWGGGGGWRKRRHVVGAGWDWEAQATGHQPWDPLVSRGTGIKVCCLKMLYVAEVGSRQRRQPRQGRGADAAASELTLASSYVARRGGGWDAASAR